MQLAENDFSFEKKMYAINISKSDYVPTVETGKTVTHIWYSHLYDTERSIEFSLDCCKQKLIQTKI